MSFVYPQVTIGSNSRDSFAASATADAYFADVPSNDAVWAAKSSLQKAQGLRQATLLLDRLTWAGVKTDATNALAWPRSGVVDKEGAAVDSATLPTRLVNATCELALAILADATVLSDSTGTASNVKRAKGGTAEVEFFGPNVGTRLPSAVQEWIADYFGSSSGTGIGPTGTNGCSEFDDSDPTDVFTTRLWP